MSQKKSRSCRLTRVKICGLSTEEAVARAVAEGADFIGFVFAKSKRQVPLEKARDLAKAIPASVKTVGVFVSPSLEEVQTAIEAVPLDMVQIHGSFGEEAFSSLSVPSIRAIQVHSDLTDLQTKADYLLFDAPLAGSGQTFDWQTLDTSQLTKPFFIAGGLHAQNVAQAIAQFQPYAVDVSSGVETDGQKDVDKISQFIKGAKNDIPATR